MTNHSKLVIFNAPFRCFFLFGALFSILSICLWLWVLFSNTPIEFYGGAYWWHIHEMIYGFTLAIIIGFLLTAVQNWTGIQALSGTPLMVLFLLWVLPRIMMLMPNLISSLIPSELIMLLDLSVIPYVMVVLSIWLGRVKQWHNFVFLFILGPLFGLNVLFYLDINSPLKIALWGQTGVLLIGLLICMMGARVIPLFTRMGCQIALPETPMLVVRSQMILLILTIISFVAFDARLTGILSCLAGVLTLVRLSYWRSWQTLKVPLVWSLHLSYACIAIGWIHLGLVQFGVFTNLSNVIHWFTIGGIGGMILGMIARVSLGHTGRSIQISSKLLPIAFISLFISCLLRVLINDSIYWQWLVAGILWAIGYAIFVWLYTKPLCQPRVDGRAG